MSVGPLLTFPSQHKRLIRPSSGGLVNERMFESNYPPLGTVQNIVTRNPQLPEITQQCKPAKKHGNLIKTERWMHYCLWLRILLDWRLLQKENNIVIPISTRHEDFDFWRKLQITKIKSRIHPHLHSAIISYSTPGRVLISISLKE